MEFALTPSTNDDNKIQLKALEKSRSRELQITCQSSIFKLKNELSRSNPQDTSIWLFSIETKIIIMMAVSAAAVNNITMNQKLCVNSTVHSAFVQSDQSKSTWKQLYYITVSLLLCYESNQPLCSYQIKYHQTYSPFFTASDTTSYWETTCIIKNKLNHVVLR